jgi:hypothetical protein
MLQKLLLLLEDRSALLRHEVCYAIGQTGMVKAAPVLVAILQNTRSLLSWETCAPCYIAVYPFLIFNAILLFIPLFFFGTVNV